jgi:hypothetical protein
MLVVLAAGTGLSLWRADALTTATAFRALLTGLFGLVLFQFTVGNVWGYAVEYYNAGGSWTDPPFLAPFVVAVLGGGAAAVREGSVAVGAWVAFWLFVVAAAVLAVGAWLVVGYREAAG